MLQEEASLDAEISHGAERISTLWIGEKLFAQDVTGADSDTAVLRRDDMDTDADGLVNSVDLDDDGDGLPDDWEKTHGFDPLEWTDNSIDEDGDTLTRLQESELGTDPGLDDTDSDGVPDASDAFPTDGEEWSDADDDGLGDNADPDDDDDRIADAWDAFPFDPNEWADADADGVGDGVDPDDDNDGVLDVQDAFPLDKTRSGMQTVGSASANEDWQTIALTHQYQNPVLVAGPPTYNDNEPGVARLRAISSNSLELRFEEWQDPNGEHASETVSYLVIEEGIFSKPDGSVWEAGTFELSGSGHENFSTESFRVRFEGPPALFLTVQTANDASPVTVRAKEVTAGGFKAGLFEDDPLIADHGTETIGYLAVYAPSGSSTIILEWVDTAYDLEAVDVGSDFVPVGETTLKLQQADPQGEPMPGTETVDTLRLSEQVFAQVVSVSDTDTASLRRQDGPACPDGDGDEACDEDDNCPYIPNGDQLDTDQNAIGDACQCGDVNRDGLTNITDVLMIARGQVHSGSEGERFGDVNNDASCNLSDALIIARGQQGSLHEDQHCPAYHGLCADTDGDGVCNENDNCPNVPNADQLDTDESGVGDACQCGDVNGDGLTNLTDVLIIARGQVPAGSEAERLGDVNHDTFCNLSDALMIARGQQGSAPEDQHCPAYQGP
jgi:hypothetical protein